MTNDTTTPVAPQAGDPGVPQPQAGSTPPEPQAGDGEETLSLEEAKKLRSEAANLRKRLKETESKAAELDRIKAEIEASKLSETERLQKQYEEMREQLDDEVQAHFEARIDRLIDQQAISLGVKPSRTDLVSKLIDWEDIEINTESGEATNIRDLVEKVVKEFPELVGKSAPTSGGATNPPRSQSTAPAQLSWEVVSKMTPGEYDARRVEIQQWMQSNPPRFR